MRDVLDVCDSWDTTKLNRLDSWHQSSKNDKVRGTHLRWDDEMA